MGCSFCRPSFCVNNPSIYSRIAITQVGTSKQTTQSHKNQQAYQCNNRQIGQNHKRQSNPQTPSPSQYARIVLPTDLFHFAAPSLNLIGQLVLREPIAVTVERARLIRQVEESPPYPMVAMPDTVEYYAARFARNGATPCGTPDYAPCPINPFSTPIEKLTALRLSSQATRSVQV